MWLNAFTSYINQFLYQELSESTEVIRKDILQ